MIVSAVSSQQKRARVLSLSLTAPFWSPEVEPLSSETWPSPIKGSPAFISSVVHELCAGRDSVARTSLEDQGLWSQKNKQVKASTINLESTKKYKEEESHSEAGRIGGDRNRDTEKDKQTSNVPDTKPERDTEGLQDHKPCAVFPRWDVSRESPPAFPTGLQTILTPGETGFNRPRQLGTVGLRDLPWTARGGFSAWSVQSYVCPECTLPLLCPCNHICLFSFRRHRCSSLFIVVRRNQLCTWPGVSPQLVSST